MIKFNEHRLFTIIKSPVISEKSTFVADNNEQIIFAVASDANKQEIKAAVELLFKVQVKSVNVLNVMGKNKRHGRFLGKRSDWKKAYVSLKPGQEINFADVQ